MERYLFGICLDDIEPPPIGRDHWGENFLNDCEDFVLHSAVHQACIKFTTGLDPTAIITLGLRPRA
jgi:hypothetical protein